MPDATPATICALAAVLRDEAGTSYNAAAAVLHSQLTPEQRCRLAHLAVAVLHIEEQLELADSMGEAAAHIRAKRLQEDPCQAAA